MNIENNVGRMSLLPRSASASWMENYFSFPNADP